MDVLKKRTSKTQYHIYIKYLKEHKMLITGKLKPTNDPQSVDALWQELADELNSCGDGPIRDVAGWKKAFTEWKSASRKKARENKPLSELDRTVIELTGSGAVTGLDVKEVGLPDKEQKANSHTTNVDGAEPAYGEPAAPSKSNMPTGKTKSSMKEGTGDVLCDTYNKAVCSTGEKLEAISQAILEVAGAINRYCDIVESSGTIKEIHYVEQDVSNFEDAEAT